MLVTFTREYMLLVAEYKLFASLSNMFFHVAVFSVAYWNFRKRPMCMNFTEPNSKKTFLVALQERIQNGVCRILVNLTPVTLQMKLLLT